MRQLRSLAAVFLPATLLAAADKAEIAGTWRGQSLCASEAPSCHNETVVYYIKAVPGRPAVVSVQADKIADGKPITMGTGEWQYDRAQNTLEWRMPRQVWKLKIDGGHMEGALTLADGTVFRKVTLAKDQ